MTNETVFLLERESFIWYSQKQKITVTFITEAEYISLSNTEKVTVWVRSFLHELWLHEMINELVQIIDNQQSKAIQLLDNNMSSLALVKNSEFHARTKHINIQYHHIHKLAEDSVVKLEHCNINNMTADYLIKSLTRKKFIIRIRQLDMKWRSLIDELLDCFI